MLPLSSPGSPSLGSRENGAWSPTPSLHTLPKSGLREAQRGNKSPVAQPGSKEQMRQWAGLQDAQAHSQLWWGWEAAAASAQPLQGVTVPPIPTPQKPHLQPRLEPEAH